MAEINAYKLSLTAAEAAKGILAGYDAASTVGLLLADGTGRVRAAQPGRDYGYGMLEGNGPPSTSVAANIGQHYFDMAATAPPYEYICVGYTATGFVWKVFGENGAGFKVLGRFDSLESLQEALASGLIPAAQPGDAYFIGTTAPYPVYYFDGLTLRWTYYGPLGSSGGGGDAIGIPPHGSTGQVLGKNSDADYDVSWMDAVPDGSIGTAKLAKDAVTAEKIPDGSMSTPKYMNNSITAAKIAKGAVSVTFTATIPAAGWVEETGGFYIDITVEGLTDDDEIIPGLDYSQLATGSSGVELAEAASTIYRFESAANLVRAHATEIPAIAVPAKFKAVRK